MLDAINRLLAETPEFRGLFAPRTVSPSLRWWKRDPKKGQRQRRYAYSVMRCHGPKEPPETKEAFWAILYELHGNVWEIRRAMRFRAKRKAMERAYAWFLADAGRGDGDAVAKAKTDLAKGRESNRKWRESREKMNAIFATPKGEESAPRTPIAPPSPDIDDQKTGLDARIHESSPDDEVGV